MGTLIVKALRRCSRFFLLIPIILAGLVFVGAVYPFLSARTRDRANKRWSRILMGLCGIQIVPLGQPILQGPVLLVANHVSWADIFAINSVRATAFIAKSEIRRWPVVGVLVAGAGTLFIERGQRQAVNAVGAAMRARFDQGDSVGLFPEGTTTEGFGLLPFHSGLFEPVRFTAVSVQPVVLRYRHRGQRSSFAAFVGEETLVANLWRVLGGPAVSVEVEYLPPIAIDCGDAEPPSRQQLSDRARTMIADALTRD
jgi:1-acyl-sn-glycerol-3-phosphate acyltransferase